MESSSPTRTERNVGNPERWVSGIAGGTLVAAGLSRRSMPGVILALAGAALIERAITGHCRFYKALHINRADPDARRVVRRSLTVRRPREDVYAFWRNPENLSQLSDLVLEVRREDDRHSHWKVSGAGITFEWRSEIFEDHPNELISWKSIDNTAFENAGTIRLEDAMTEQGPGTHIHLNFAYLFGTSGRGSLIGSISEKLLEQRIDDALQRMRQILESGGQPTVPEHSSNSSTLTPML